MLNRDRPTSRAKCWHWIQTRFYKICTISYHNNTKVKHFKCGEHKLTLSKERANDDVMTAMAAKPQTTVSRLFRDYCMLPVSTGKSWLRIDGVLPYPVLSPKICLEKTPSEFCAIT